MSTIANAVKILWTRNEAALTAAGYALEDFANKTVADINETVKSLTSAATPAAAAPQTATAVVQAQAADDDQYEDEGTIEMKEYMGIPYQENTYGKGRNKTTYRNAKFFQSSAYMNVTLPIAGRNLKIAGINLQDLSDGDTRKGRASLLHLLKKHGVDKMGNVKFEVNFNVAELMEGSDDDFLAELELFDFDAQ